MVVIILTHCDVAESVEWFVDSISGYGDSMAFLTIGKGLERDHTIHMHTHTHVDVWRGLTHIVECSEPIVIVSMILKHILAKLSHKHWMTHFTTTSYR